MAGVLGAGKKYIAGRFCFIVCVCPHHPFCILVGVLLMQQVVSKLNDLVMKFLKVQNTKESQYQTCV